MLSDYQQIVKYLRLIQTQRVHEAERALKQYGQTGLTFLVGLYTVITNNNIDEWIKITAASFFNNTICNNISDISQNQCSQLLCKIIKDQSISNLIKQTLEKSIVMILQIVENQQLSIWQNIAINLVQSQNLKQIGYFIINCMTLAELDAQQYHPFIKKIYFISLNNIYIGLVNKNIPVNIILDYIKTLSTLIDKLFQSNTPQNDSILHFLSVEMKLHDFIRLIYEYETPQTDIYICINQNCQQVNMLKYQCAELHQRLLSYAQKQPYHTQTLPLLLNIIDNIIRSIAILTLNKQSIDKYKCQDYLTSLLKILIIFYKAYYLQLGKQIWLNIAQYILFPLLEATQDQRIQFQQSYEDFNALAEDVCDKQSMGILKTQAAKLFQTICDLIPQSATYSISKAVNSIKYKLNFTTNQNNQQKILQLQTSFLILSILSYKLSKQNHKQMINTLKIILCDERIYKMPPFQISRLFLFLAYNYGDLFIEFNDGGHLIMLALQYQKHPTTSLCGLDFVANIADDYYNDIFLLATIEKLSICKHALLYDIIRRAIEAHRYKIQQKYYQKLLIAIFTKIQTQFNQIKLNQQKKNTQTIVQCLNLLYYILKIINQLNYNKIKQIIWKIVLFYQDSIQLQLDQQVIRIINEFIKCQQSLGQHYLELLTKILKGFQKDQYTQTEYLILLNSYIMKSRNVTIIKNILKTLMTGLMYHSMELGSISNRHTQKLAIGHHFLLLQNLLAMHGTELDDEDLFSQISLMCIKYLPQDNQQKLVLDKSITARALNLLILCHMHVRNPQAIKYLLKFHDQHIYQGYNKNVLLQLLGKQLFRQSDQIILTQMINIIVRVITQSKQDQKQNNKQQKIKRKKATSTKITIKRIQNYQVILQFISTPFQYQINQIVFLKQTLNTMKSANLQIYTSIVKSLTQDIREKLNLLIHSTTIDDKQSRHILKVVGIKQNTQISRINVMGKRGSYAVEMKGQQEEEQDFFKRKRVTKKRQEKWC